MLDFSDMADPPLSEKINRAYQNGYAAGHEEGYQQGQKDGYQAGKKAAARTQNLASNHGAHRHRPAIERMATLVPQPPNRDPWDLISSLGRGEEGLDSELFSDLV
jgi:hypothetical protein